MKTKGKSEYLVIDQVGEEMDTFPTLALAKYCALNLALTTGETFTIDETPHGAWDHHSRCYIETVKPEQATCETMKTAFAAAFND